MESGTYRWVKEDDTSRKPKMPNQKKLGRLALLAAVLVFLLILATTCWYTVDDKEQAVVTTFGKVTDVTGAGVHFKLPFGIQQAHKVEVNVYQKLELGYRTDSAQ